MVKQWWVRRYAAARAKAEAGMTTAEYAMGTIVTFCRSMSSNKPGMYGDLDLSDWYSLDVGHVRYVR
ncbi:DUF4244 domain-containing protein [Streptomyces sp. GMR22]|uniref:DUF4244 domain-containing protein n=1 Tax=Streptomyces sp. GMR22 TaxID=2759524 RepID=UPI001F2B843B|nr:DUF4244 domain-containing protein [Streptomyces sp. GMR22]